MQSISEIMTRDVSVVSPDNNVQWAAQVMRDRNIGSLPVCNGARIVGMLTDRDIVTRAVVNGKPASQIRVADIMSGQVFWCFDDQTVGEVLQEMGDLQVRRIPVVSRDSKELVGIVSLGDLAIRQDADVESTLEDVSSPIPLQRESAGKHPSLH